MLAESTSNPPRIRSAASDAARAASASEGAPTINRLPRPRLITPGAIVADDK
jgi:hypothetical protein